MKTYRVLAMKLIGCCQQAMHKLTIPTSVILKTELIKLGLFLVLFLLYLTFLQLYAGMAPYVFLVSVCLGYLLVVPAGLLSPVNMVFLFYAFWYGVAPVFAARYSGLDYSSEKYPVLYVYVMASVLTMFYCLSLFSRIRVGLSFVSFNFSQRTLKLLYFIFVLLFVASFFFYLESTGGLGRWIEDPKNAFMQRKGAGASYLLFFHSFIIVLAFVAYRNNHKFSMFSMIFWCVLIFTLNPFVGSKLKVIILYAVLFFPYLGRVRLFSFKTVLSLAIVFFVVAFGLFVRNLHWMQISDFLPYFFNYFSTLELLHLVLMDYAPGDVATMALPFNRVFMPLGFSYVVPYHDMSVWLTSLYFPHVHDAMATDQWPIEADFYLTFGYWPGILFLAVYSFFLAQLYRVFQGGYVAFCVIFILEYFMIISHLRGGFFIWWYWYLIPFYGFVYLLFGNTKTNSFQ